MIRELLFDGAERLLFDSAPARALHGRLQARLIAAGWATPEMCMASCRLAVDADEREREVRASLAAHDDLLRDVERQRHEACVEREKLRSELAEARQDVARARHNAILECERLVRNPTASRGSVADIANEVHRLLHSSAPERSP